MNRPSSHSGIDWYACTECAELIEGEHWKGLVGRGLAAHTESRPVPNGEEGVLRAPAVSLVRTFRVSRLLPV